MIEFVTASRRSASAEGYGETGRQDDRAADRTLEATHNFVDARRFVTKMAKELAGPKDGEAFAVTADRRRRLSAHPEGHDESHQHRDLLSFQLTGREGPLRHRVQRFVIEPEAVLVQRHGDT